MAQFNGVSTFDEALSWKAEAVRLCDDVKAAIDGAARNKDSLDHEPCVAEDPFPVYASLAPSRRDKPATKARDDLDQPVSISRVLDEFVTDMMGLLPCDADEKKAILRQLRLKKSEIDAAKREINVQIRTMRAAARRESPGVFSRLVGAVARSRYPGAAGRCARLDKEAALARHEGRAGRLDQALLALGALINRVGRFRWSFAVSGPSVTEHGHALDGP